MKCPNCKKDVLFENINIQANIAKCDACSFVFKISDILEMEPDDGFDMNDPPKGAWIGTGMNRVVIGATTRNPIAFFLVPFMLVWSGFSIGGIYGSQIISGEFDPFMSLFGIPFIIGSIVFWTITLMTIWGKVEVSISREGGKVFTGLGKIGYTRKFSWDEVSGISENSTSLKYPGGQKEALRLEGKKRITFGRGIRDNRRYYIYRSLKTIISKQKSNSRFV